MSISRIRARCDLCRRLHALSHRQRAALAESNYDELIAILGEKRSILEQLAELASLVHSWNAERVFLTAADRAAGEELLRESQQLLADAARCEQDDVAELTRQRDSTQAALHEIASAGRVHAAYRDSLAPVTHRSLDVDR